MNTLTRKTKIVCTIGPSSSSVETMVALIESGMDAVRLNFSHSTHAEHRTALQHVREASKRTGRHVAVIQDLQGPKIRIGSLQQPSYELQSGNGISITTEDISGTETRISTTYQHLPTDVKPGDRILIDDGLIELKVLTTQEKEIFCKVVEGGVLKEHKGINLPGVDISAPSLTEKDIEDVTFGLENDVDYVALSFVRSAADIHRLRDEMKKRNRSVPIIAKIEKGEALKQLDDIVRIADAVMVARGDLGVELQPEEVPILQKVIIERCNHFGKPVIVATQMLESMITHPRPTRAEASDVANAVLDGADAVMLSGETSVGRFPIGTVTIMERIIREAEEHGIASYDIQPGPVKDEETIQTALARSAVVLSERIHASVIAVVTHSGAAAQRISQARPRAQIIAATDRERIVRQMNLVWGVRGLLLKSASDTNSDVTLDHIRDELRRHELVSPGDFVVYTAGMPVLERGKTNMIKVEQIQIK